jgi:hypothetical protein
LLRIVPDAQAVATNSASGSSGRGSSDWLLLMSELRGLKKR